MKTKTIILLIAAAIICATAVLCFLTWPDHTNMELHAVRTNADGTQVTDLGTITFEATKTKHLRNEDRLHVTVELPQQAGFWLMNYESGTTVLDYSLLGLKDNYVVTILPCHSSSTNDFGNCWIGYSAEEGMLIISDPFNDGSYIVASIDESVSALDILEFFPIITYLSIAAE